MRRELITFIAPFARGARLGAYVAGATLGLSLLGAVAVLATQPGAETTTYVASDAPAAPPDRPMKSRATFQIDRGLLEAAERLDQVGSRPLQLSREATEAAPPPAPEPEPAVAAAEAVAPPPPAPAVPVEPPAPPLVVGGEDLRAVIAEYFPNQVDLAYNVVMCESSGNARAISPAGYYGMWQFDIATWASVGGSGLPSNASIEEQMMRARMLYDARGWSPWGCA